MRQQEQQQRLLTDLGDGLAAHAGDLRHQVDFRSIYAAVLKDWLGTDDTAILGAGFERMTGLV